MAPKPPWSDLPQELLSIIANSLTSNPFDILAFCSVCKSWRSSFPSVSYHDLSPALPLVTPQWPYIRTYCIERTLSVTVIYSLRLPSENSVRQPTNWICFVDQWDKHKTSVRKPFSALCYSDSLPEKFPCTFNLLDIHASELGRFYNFVDTRQIKGMVQSKSMVRDFIKVILLPNMLHILVLSRYGELRLIRLWEGALQGTAKSWQIILQGINGRGNVEGFRLDDIVEFKGMVLGVDRTGKVYEFRIDYDPVTFDEIIPTPTGGGGRRKRLVESLGELYLVAKCDANVALGVSFKVYQLVDDEAGVKEWSQVTEIGDRVFFFDENFSFSASTQQLGGYYKRNCIVYKAHSFPQSSRDSVDTKIFSDLKADEFDIGVCHLDDLSRIVKIERYPSLREVLWPPPSWICGIDKFHKTVDYGSQISEYENVNRYEVLQLFY